MVLKSALRAVLDVLEMRLQSLTMHAGSMRNEYHQIDSGAENDVCTTACKPDNQKKNRYTDVLPFERTRVKLVRAADGVDYINASLICSDGHEVPSWGYISAQGPLENTAEDHWRMVIENQVPAIIMLTKLQEGTRVKCWSYFPENEGQEAIFGHIVVRCKVRQEPEPELILRILELTDKRDNATHTCHHLMFMGWPDHGVPSQTKTIRNVCAILQNSFKTRYPPLVHCSAGIGRSGTFIVLDIIMRRLRFLLEETLPDDETEFVRACDIKHLVTYLRDQRMGMVQTEEQYLFCYAATIDYIKDILSADS